MKIQEKADGRNGTNYYGGIRRRKRLSASGGDGEAQGEDGAIYVSTGTSSAKTAHFKANPKAGVSIVGAATASFTRVKWRLLRTRAVKRSLWGDWMLDHFPGGVEDPEALASEIYTRVGDYWIDNAFVKNDKYMNLPLPELRHADADCRPVRNECRRLLEPHRILLLLLQRRGICPGLCRWMK